MKFELKLRKQNIPKNELLSDLQRVAKLLGQNTLTHTIYRENGKFAINTFLRKFGSWNNALEGAGLKVTKRYNITIEELFLNLEKVWEKLGRQPKYRDMNVSFSKFSYGPYQRVFGAWNEALEAFVNYMNEEGSSSSYEGIKRLKVESSTKHKTKRDINWRLRFLVLRRDNFKCKACGRSPATDPKIVLHVDHIKAWANGGETVLENLQTLCSKCNIGKSNVL